MKWRYLDPPATWTQLETEGGNLQWQIEGTTCAFTLSQLNGLTAQGDPPTNAEVVENFVQQLTIGAFANAVVEPIATDTRVFRSTIDGEAAADVEFAGAKVSWPSIPATGQIYAYTNGDYANVSYTVCGGDLFDQYWASDFDPYLDTLVADITS